MSLTDLGVGSQAALLRMHWNNLPRSRLSGSALIAGHCMGVYIERGETIRPSGAIRWPG